MRIPTKMQQALARALSTITFLAACVAGTAHANVIITGTRVIFPGNDSEVSVKLDNVGELPALVQTWIDTGDVHAAPNAADAPFVIMPPVFRMEPGKGQTLRLMYTKEPLPQDRESVFWLNVLDIPPKPKSEADANLLQMAFRSRIKIFFRPNGLDAEGALQAPSLVSWTLVKDDSGKYVVEGSNPTAYCVNVPTLQVKSGGRAYDAVDGGMILPGSSLRFPIKDMTTKPATPPEFSYSFVNDYGVVIESKGQVTLQ